MGTTYEKVDEDKCQICNYLSLSKNKQTFVRSKIRSKYLAKERASIKGTKKVTLVAEVVKK